MRALLIVFALWVHSFSAQADDRYDIVVYGGTSAGLVAGFQAIKMGKSVVAIEPTDRIGGLSTGGLGQTDIGNKNVIGGLSREFYQRIAAHYARDDSWQWQQRAEYRSTGQSKTDAGEASMWTFEPSAALKVFHEWVAETGLKIVYNERLDRESGIEKDGARIESITMESGRRFVGEMFIDATYEGDLFAAAGVSYTVGREAVDLYGEFLNGVQTKMAKYHNFVDGVDPYRVKGDPSSGLLPFIDADGPGEEGAGDKRVQAYCFRMCLTDHPENRIPFEKPEGYREEWYELLLRNYEAGEKRLPWINSAMPNRKTDTNNCLGFSTDFIGQNYAYPEASYSEREQIVARHRLYQQGLMWTLAYHPRMPEWLREKVSAWGTCQDEFSLGNGWQQQLYIREARRMVSDFVMTQNHCQQRESIEDSVGMGAYTMDSHHVQRYVTAGGYVKNEGDVQVGGFPPYPISYRSVVPKRDEGQNLLVPVSLSASHMAFGSIRMEPVFMVLAESCATAASMAIDEGVAVQDVDYPALKEKLLASGQVLNREGGEAIGGIIVDEYQAQLTGDWPRTTLSAGYRSSYVHDGNTNKGTARATYTAKLPKAGKYEIQIAYTTNANRATNVPVTIRNEGREQVVTVNQQQTPDRADVGFHSLGVFECGKDSVVEISNEGTDGYVIADAIRWMAVAE